MPYAKNHIRVNVPKRSGFDKSHRNSGSGLCGTLIPLMCDEVVPNSRVSLRVPIAAQMPPLASDTYMNVKLKLEAFFVPSRLLCGSFESFFTDFPQRINYASPSSSAPSSNYWSNVKGMLPVAILNNDNSTFPFSAFGAGSLADYLGFCVNSSFDTDSRGLSINLMKFIAYHLVWQEYYRNPRVQNPAFAPLPFDATYNSTPLRISAAPYSFLHDQYEVSGSTFVQNYALPLASSADLIAFTLADGANLFSLRQRNFGLDKYTGARISPQQGDASSVGLSLSVEGEADAQGDVTGSATGSFSIAALRAANSLQQFRERNNLPSPRLVDQVKARYGANLADGVAQRPICIGTASYDMNTRGVDQTGVDNVGGSTANPFSSVAAQYGRAGVVGRDYLIEDFVANEPGYILVLMSQVPEVSYPWYIDPGMRRYTAPGSIVEMANSLLQNVGDEPIYKSELDPSRAAVVDSVFGYTDRFADFMFIRNQIHGLLRPGSSLSAFVAQRSLMSANPELSDAFLKIPTTYLNSVLAVSSEASGLTYWYDAILDYKVSMPLAEFSIPSLQDPAYEHGHSVSLRRNGQIF